MLGSFCLYCHFVCDEHYDRCTSQNAAPPAVRVVTFVSVSIYLHPSSTWLHLVFDETRKQLPFALFECLPLCRNSELRQSSTPNKSQGLSASWCFHDNTWYYLYKQYITRTKQSKNTTKHNKTLQTQPKPNQTTNDRCGKNYGWSRFEGSYCQAAVEDNGQNPPCAGSDRSGFEFPVYQYCHPDYLSDDPDYTGGDDFCGDREIEGHVIIGGLIGFKKRVTLWVARLFLSLGSQFVCFFVCVFL